MSSRGRILQIWIAVLAVPSLLAAAYPLQVRIDALSETVRPQTDELLVHSGRVLKNLSLGYDALLADIYWTRVVQYYGGKRRAHDPHFDSLWPLLDVTTTLDPHLIVAYKFGALFLAEEPPRGAGHPEMAVEFIRRGIANNPEEWRFWADLGFIYYWEMKDYHKAAEAYLEGSRQPHALPWMAPMAARIAEQGESPETSYFLWKQVYDSTPDPAIRHNAREHLGALKAEADMKYLEQQSAEFERRFHRSPRSVRELVEAGLLPGPVLDLEGYPYEMGPDGKMKLNPSSPISLDILKPPLPQ
jgi:tetratricopeptide (TPR) repeat protein